MKLLVIYSFFVIVTQLILKH